MDTTTPDSLAQRRLWQLISPALPVGAYSYSGGFEYAIDAGWVTDRAGAEAWMQTQLQEVLARLDVPILARLYAAWQVGDLDAVQMWNTTLRASRESGELEAEDLHLGASLARLLRDLEIPDAETLAGFEPCFATAFARAAAHWQIPLRDAAEGLLWSWCENQVAVALKLIPLGQTDGQRLMLALGQLVGPAVAQGLALADDAIGASAPGVALASARHETQYTRLFRS